MRGQLDAALATLHTIIASSSGGKGGSRGRKRSRVRSRQAAVQQVQAAAGLQQHPAVAAEDAAWLNAAPEAGRPRNAEQQVGCGQEQAWGHAGQMMHALLALLPCSNGTCCASHCCSFLWPPCYAVLCRVQALEAAEDELLLLWSSVQKEQAAGLELRQAATAAAAATGRRSAAGSSNGAVTAAADDGQVMVSSTPTAAAAAGGAGGSPRRWFTVQAAPAAAFSLDESDDKLDHKPHHKQQQQEGFPEQQQQQQQELQVGSGDDAVREADGCVEGHKGGARFQALQQKLHLPGRLGAAAADRDPEGQQQLLGSSAADNSSSSSHVVQQQPPHQLQQQHVEVPMSFLQQQQQHKGRLVDPGQECNVFASLWAMLCDVKAVARGPERAAFAIACCLAVFDQATASTAIINYAPEVLATHMGVQDQNLAIMYPAAIALAKVVGTLIAAVTVDKYGRKPLLFWGGLGCAIFLALAGLALSFKSVALFLAALCLFLFNFSVSWAGLYWVIVSEIFSMGAKSPATSAATSLLFLTGAAVNFVYLSLIHWSGGVAFGLFGLVAAGSAWYVWARVPETKGQTLAEIQALLAPSTAATGSPLVSPRDAGTGPSSSGLVRGLGSGPYAGYGSGSPMLPESEQSGASSGQVGGDTRLVELPQLMSRDSAQQQ
jgi:hypothetical protein